MKISVISLCAIFLLGQGSCRLGEDQAYVLPEGFTGWVVIIFNQPNGQKTKYENGRRVYEIPKDGILRTQFAPHRDWHLPDKFFYSDNGKLIEIPESDYKDLKSDSIQACCMSSGKTAKTSNDNWIEFNEFFVGTKAQIDQASERANKTNIADFVQPNDQERF